MQNQADFELDLTDLDSPLPMLKTKDAIDRMAPGQIMLVKTTAIGSEQNIRNLMANHPSTLLAFDKVDGILHFLIEKTASQPC